VSKQEVKALPDVYATILEQDLSMVLRLAEILELRAADPQQQAMREDYLSAIEFPKGARVLEVGCGPGPVTRALARWPRVGEVIGIDPSPVFIGKARELGAGIQNLSFEVADGLSLPFPEARFDVAVFHTTLCHVLSPQRALAEAFRVIRPGGWLAIFDGDYNTTSVATSASDPLQACVEVWVSNFVNDPWLMRRLQGLVRNAGFNVMRYRSHAFIETSKPDYMLTIVERAILALLSSNRISDEFATALKTEARHRVETGDFYGYIAYGSLVARKST